MTGFYVVVRIVVLLIEVVRLGFRLGSLMTTGAYKTHVKIEALCNVIKEKTKLEY